MKKLLNTLVSASVIATAASASYITAVKVDENLDKVSYSYDVWTQAKMTEVTLYPQTTIKFNDKMANKMNESSKAIKAEVGAVYNGSRIAFIVKWPDGTKNVTTGNCLDRYADGFAFQFASEYSDPKTLPYIGMGSDGRPVVVHLQKEAFGTYEPNGYGDVAHQVNPNQTAFFGKELDKFNKKVKSLATNDYERSFVAEGFRSTTEIKDGSNASYARIGYEGKGWSGTLSRPLKDQYLDLNSAVIPVAIAVWDGGNLGRNGLKYLTSWTAVKLEGKSGSEALLTALNEKSKGDAAKGKEAVMNNGCTGCHQIEPTDPATYMGPALTNIGGYATADYLRESLVNPSAVVVPGYNRNAHSSYMWYTLEGDKRVSTMPGFDYLEKSDIEDIVAYLQTLKAEVK